MTGIYCIENTVNGKRYIGQAQDIKERWRQHRSALRSRTHYNGHLQRAWGKYGSEAFSFCVLELCDIEALSTKEMLHIAKFNTFRDGYNMTAGGEGTRGYHHTQEHKDHMSALYSGRKFSESTLKKMSEAKKGILPI